MNPREKVNFRMVKNRNEIAVLGDWWWISLIPLHHSWLVHTHGCPPIYSQNACVLPSEGARVHVKTTKIGNAWARNFLEKTGCEIKGLNTTRALPLLYIRPTTPKGPPNSVWWLGDPQGAKGGSATKLHKMRQNEMWWLVLKSLSLLGTLLL